MYKVGIIGDGYTAADLLRLLALHSMCKPLYIFSTENIGRRIDQVYPHLMGFSDLVCEKTDLEKLKEVDVVFLALPHGISVPIVKELINAGIKCIDLGADFRFKDAKTYSRYYEKEHDAVELLPNAVYGLSELYREKIKSADLVANPGCFPTGAITMLAPLLEAGLINKDNIIIDSKTGVSGAGRTPSANNNFCEVNEGIKAYGVGTHRHAPEIEQELSFASDSKVSITFTPHLLPINRGILTTAYASLAKQASAAKIRETLEEKFRSDYFIRILPEGIYPHSKWVYGSNFLDIGIFVNEENGRVILISALDNLCKGASGQAIQNMNIMLGIDECEGLKIAGIHP